MLKSDHIEIEIMLLLNKTLFLLLLKSDHIEIEIQMSI